MLRAPLTLLPLGLATVVALAVSAGAGSGCYRLSGIVTCADGAGCPGGHVCDELGICRDPAGEALDEDGGDVVDAPTEPGAPPVIIERGRPPAPPSEGEGEGEGEGGSVTVTPAHDFCAGHDGPGVILCEDFESETALSAWQSDVAGGAGSVVALTNDAWAGSQALRASTMGGTAFASRALPSPLPNDLWWRARVRLQVNVATHFDHPRIAKLGPYPSGDGDYLALMLEDQTNRVYVGDGNIFGPHVGWNEGRSLDASGGAWTCIEMHVVLSADASGTVELFVDGADTPLGSENIATFTPESVGHVALGLDGVDDDASVDVSFDDVVVSGGRVGCTE